MRALLLALVRGAGALCYRLRLHGVVIWLRRRSPRVLLYHACEPTESDYIRGLKSNTAPEVFRAQLEFLARHYRVISLSELEAGRVPERAVVITFDDGYRSVYEHAFPLLRERAMPATVYLVGSVMHGGSLVWVNELNAALHRGGEQALAIARRAAALPLDATAADVVAHFQATYDAARVTQLLEELRAVAAARAADEAPLYMSWSEARAMASCGVTFGNHTMSHPALSRLDAAEQHAELATAAEIIRRELGSCTSLSYPFGDFDESARRIARETGHASVVEVGGLVDCNALDRIGRVVVPPEAGAAFFAELEFVTPLKARLARLFRS